MTAVNHFQWEAGCFHLRPCFARSPESEGNGIAVDYRRNRRTLLVVVQEEGMKTDD